LVCLDHSIDRRWLTVACAAAVVIGHVYPVWYGFRGGKGAATLIGVLVGLQPAAVVPVFAVWLITVMISGYVGLATMIAVASFPLYFALTESDPSLAVLSFGCAMVLFVCFTHRANIIRMRDGAENRVQRLWLFRPRN
jgi:acyl phosphate:glycerol-3-phosphate acyltransferase